MSQQNEELPFFDHGVDESEHLIIGGAYRPGDTRSPADRAAPAFPRPTTNAGPQTVRASAPSTGSYSGYPPAVVSDAFGVLSPASSSPYSNSGGSSAVSANSGYPTYEYASQQRSSNPFMGSYPIQDAASATMGYSPWPNTGVSEFGDTMLYGAESMTLASPISGFGQMTATSESLFTDLDHQDIDELDSVMVNMTTELDASLQSRSDVSPASKYSKVSFEQDVGDARALGHSMAAAEIVPGSSNSSGGSEHGKSKLRSASRSSKNTSQRTGETSEQRKSRNAHNLVEKQYRNRLNAQFEGLLNALPESIRSPNGVGVGGPSDSDPNVDVGERRLSKGDVLEMSTRYIKTLERDCGRLEREREELARNIDRLQAMITGVSSMQEEPFSGG